MPLYDFKCPECGRVKEILIRNNKAPIPVCEHVDRTWPMIRQIANSVGDPVILGFNEENGYSTPDERFKPSGIPGIKVQTRKGRGWG